VIEIIQTWWHIEDQIRPSKARLIRQVMDIYTDESLLTISGNLNILGLKIKARNLNRELAFIEMGGETVINLGNLDDWPPAPEKGLKHVKLDVVYTIINPNFKNYYLGLIYESAFEIDELIQPDFYITVPLGMKIRNNGKLVTIFFYHRDGIIIKEKELGFEGPFIDDDNGKERYNYLIKSNDYYTVLKDIGEEGHIGFQILYESSFDRRLYLIPAMALIFLFYSIWRVSQLISGNGTGDISIPYLLLLLASLAGTLLTFSKEGYNLPFNKLTIFSMIGLILGFAFELLYT
jgi:hypothetical protein